LLKDIVKATGLSHEAFAGVLGIDPQLFNEWLVGQRPIPAFLLPQLSTVIGVSVQDLASGKRISDAPAIWYKLRDTRLVQSDRESILLIRNVGFFLAQLETVTNSKNVLWEALFEQIRGTVNKQAPPSDQGKLAAQLYRSSRHLSHGARGIGLAIRDNLPGTGLLVIESPLPHSTVEGCSFYVGESGSEVPCLFANTYGSTWFRRNLVLMHELGHALFDLDSEAVSVDYKGEEDYLALQERRAQAFAQEMLVPMEVLRHIQSTTGFKWEDLRPRDLALLVSKTDVEARTILKAATEAGFINDVLCVKYADYDIWGELKQLTPRALDTKEFLRQTIGENCVWPANKRTTTISAARLRLPVSYVKKVLTAAREENISVRKAAEMLMMDKDVLSERFRAELAADK
jgi:DNA-binding transcriptional regulator YdaS (Cro superfamily)